VKWYVAASPSFGPLNWRTADILIFSRLVSIRPHLTATPFRSTVILLITGAIT
jgi:hypothetical protein